MLSDRVGFWGRRLRSAPLAPLLMGLCLLAVGCVPYSVHQQTKEELIKAKDANADLIKKYNTAVQQIMALKDRTVVGVPADYESLRNETERLRAEAARKVRPDFSPAEIAQIGGEDEEGALALKEVLLFAEGNADLKREAFPVLDRLLAVLTKDHASEPVIIEGHTDNQPLLKSIGQFGDNLTLGYARAHAVGAYLMTKGIPESRMIVTTYSFNKPLDRSSASTKEGRRQNRRVVVRLSTLKL